MGWDSERAEAESWASDWEKGDNWLPPTEEAPPMSTRAEIERQLAALHAQLDRIDAFPAEDPYKDGVVLKFKWYSTGSARWYTYVAVRAGNRYYTTGRENHLARTWADFVAWLIKGNVQSLERMVSKAKADTQIRKARAVTAAAFNQSVRDNVAIKADPAEAKDLFEDLVALAEVKRSRGILNAIPHTCITRILSYAKVAVADPKSADAATFLMAIARYETAMEAQRRQPIPGQP